MNINKYRFPLNLQLFADGDGSGEGAGEQGGAAGGASEDDKGTGGDDKSFSQDDVNRLISERLGKEKSKWEKDMQTKLDEAKTEAEKLAKMNAEQKAEHERQKREQALTDRENEITRRELRATALEQLSEKKLPLSLAEVLVYNDADSTNKSLDAVEKAFREAVETGVNERLKGNPPGGGGGKGGSGSAAEGFAKQANDRGKPAAGGYNPWA
jgi:hypothetical protein